MNCSVSTPFGEIVTGFSTGVSAPVAQRTVCSEVEWQQWRTDSVTAEVFVGPFAPRLPEAKRVAGCLAVLWRVRAVTPVTGISFSCQWRSLPAGADGGPDAGEGLDALTWSIGRATFSLGTEDGEFLAARALKEDGMPRRLAPELNVATVGYLPGGLRVPFSSLAPGELLQVQFLIAWTAPDAVDTADTWFAVDQRHSEVVRQLTVW
ncbi:MAG TPA: hypothetical protein VNT75_21045 [Symbiobacteriaceae bacterium]|nr:hypothetical protein [Symbiobacteriaceae bacterium]